MDSNINTPLEEKKAKQSILSALINEPSTYHITVMNDSSLPDKLKQKLKKEERKELSFTVKPPVIDTLNKVAFILNKLPKELFEDTAETIDYMNHLKEMVQIIAIFIHGGSSKNKSPMPEWYVPFLMDNCTVDELTLILHECMMKCKTDFFLPFFQSAEQMNPMMMMKYEKNEPQG